MIDISQWLISLGVTGFEEPTANNQYEFFKGVKWTDGSVTNSQYDFFKKVGQSRYEHFKQFGNERQFYKDIAVPVIKNYYTFYKYVRDYILSPSTTYNVEDYPLNWIDGTYYLTYKGNTFEVPSLENAKSEAEYNAVTLIDLASQSLTTDFTNTLLSKFVGLEDIFIANNSISVLDVTNLVNLTQLYCYGNSVSILDVVNLIELTTLHIHYTQIDFLDFTNLTKLNNFNGFGAKLNNTMNSQLLVDLDNNAVLNGYFQSSIFGGGSLTAAGQTAKTNLQAKGWTVIGI